MKHFKLILATAILVLAFNYSFGNKTIYLSLQNGKLHLSGDIDPSGMTILTSSESVTWQINDVNIESFKIEPRFFFPGSYPFTYSLPGGTVPSLTVTVPNNAGEHNWHYKVTAYVAKEKSYSIDPKIAVNPKKGIFGIIAAAIGLILAAFFGMRYLRIKLKTAK